MKTILSVLRRRVFYIKLLIFLTPIFVFTIPSIPFAPFKRITLAFLIYTIFAAGTSRNIKHALADDQFWIGLFRKRSVIFGIVSSCFLLLHAILHLLMWGLEEPPHIAYILWFDARFPMGAILIVCSIILGVLAGQDYNAEQQLDDEPSTTQASGWLYSSVGKPKRLWSWLVLIGLLPTLLTLAIVIEGSLSRGLFYAGHNHSYIDSIEWTSDHEITFRLVGFYLTDCFGCGYDHYWGVVDADTREVEWIEDEYFSEGFPETRAFRGSVVSPDGSKLAYVGNRYDIYVKQLDGGLFPTHRAYRYRASFWNRHYKELVTSLLIGLLAGIVLASPYFYTNRKSAVVRRGYIAIVIWNLAWFAGSFSDFSLLSIHSYLWKSFP